MIQSVRIPRADFARVRSLAAARKAKRQEKAAVLWPKRVKRPKSKSSSQLEKSLWDAFSLFIRLRDKKAAVAKGHIPACFYCGVNPIECAMHRIKRGKRAVKYDEQNVDGGCHSFNFQDQHDPQKFDAIFIKKKGVDLFLALEEKGRQPAPRSRATMVALTEFYQWLIQRSA